MNYVYTGMSGGLLVILSFILIKAALYSFAKGKAKNPDTIHYLYWALGVYMLLWLTTLWGWWLTCYYFSFA